MLIILAEQSSHVIYDDSAVQKSMESDLAKLSESFQADANLARVPFDAQKYLASLNAALTNLPEPDRAKFAGLLPTVLAQFQNGQFEAVEQAVQQAMHVVVNDWHDRTDRRNLPVEQRRQLDHDDAARRERIWGFYEVLRKLDDHVSVLAKQLEPVESRVASHREYLLQEYAKGKTEVQKVVNRLEQFLSVKGGGVILKVEPSQDYDTKLNNYDSFSYRVHLQDGGDNEAMFSVFLDGD